MCDDYETFEKWYKDIVVGPLNDFRKHLATCLECQEFLMSCRDEMGFKLLTISDEDFLNIIKKGKEL